MPGVLEYNHNNSGGRDWLTDGDWKRLESSGWEPAGFRGARKRFDSADEGIAEWSSLTGEDPAALGCFSCCGPPHSFSWEEDDGSVVYIEPVAPVSGTLDYY